MKNYIKNKIAVLNSKTISKIENKINFIYRSEQLKYLTLNSKEKGISDNKYCNYEIIVSLTTYGNRLFEVYLAIESIMQQTMKPNKIILWLSNALTDQNLPLTLKNQQKRGLEIKFCKDIRSYTKLIPTLRTFPSAIIITIDDDCLYNFDLIENLVNAYKKEPDLIHSARMHRMRLLNNNLIEYKKWIFNYNNYDVSPLNFPTGVGGILYPPHCFHEEVLNENIFTDICKYADDVWFKAMALYNGTMSKYVYNSDLTFTNTKYEDSSLYKINVTGKLNDIQIKAVFDKYNLYDKLI